MDSLQIKDAMSIEINFVQLKLETLMFSSKYPPPPTSLKNKKLHYIKEKKRQNTQRSIITNIKRLIGKKIFFLLKISANLA